MANFDLSNLALKAACPTNTLLYDDKGLPSVMVYIPKFTIADVITGGSSATHPAFIVNGVEKPGIYISKYQNVVSDGRAYSLPCEDPRASLTFDNARTYCEAKGNGWHLMTNAEWAAVALWCRKNGTMPLGNNNYGRDTTETIYKAIPTTSSGGQTNHVATGTGPLTWSHDGTLEGIWDMNGNVSEWQGGYRIVDGEIQIIANNDAAALADHSATSTQWKAIMPNGTLVTPGTAGTLKWDYIATPTTTNQAFHLTDTVVNAQANDTPTGRMTFSALTAKSGVNVPELMKALALFPADSGVHSGSIYMRNNGERLAFRGGSYTTTSNAGVFYCNGTYPRSNSNATLGFRSAFVNL